MPNRDQPLDFPVKGLSVTREFGEQPDQTTADCVNVASRDSIAGRLRGGSRPGFSKYIEAQSTDGAVKIQMLEAIVDPTTDALPQNFETVESDWVEHPRFPGLMIPPRGAPWSPNPTASPANITHVQSKRTKFSPSNSTETIAWASNVTSNNTMVVAVATTVEATAGIGVSVTNGNGTAFTQVGSYVEIQDPRTVESYLRLSVWKKTCNNGSNDNSIKVTAAGAVVTMAVVQLEYRGMPTSGQVDTAVENSDITNPPAPPATTGNVAVLGTKEVLLGFFSTILDSSSFTPGAGFTLRPNVDDGSDYDLRLNVVEKIGVNNPADNPSVATGTTTGGEDPYVAIGVTFKKS